MEQDEKYCPILTKVGGSQDLFNMKVICKPQCAWWVHRPCSDNPERGGCIVADIAAHLGILARYAVLHAQETGEKQE
jgi:hypothetical protein